MIRLVSGTHDMKQRVKWDKVTRSAEVKEVNKKSVVTHVINESPISVIKNRDLVDKRFKFVHDNAIYIYRSSITEEVFPADKDL
jgi:hypothetical protein